MEIVEKLKKDIELLTVLSTDLSFDDAVLEDANSLISIKNNEIIDLGATPYVEPVKNIGISVSDAVNIILKKIKSIYKFKDMNDKSKKKYKTLNLLLRINTKMTYEDYLNNGEKFEEGGAVKNFSNDTISKLESGNQFYKLMETSESPILKYKTPDNSYLYQVLLESGNLAFALIYRIENNTIVDFYQDEDLSQSINLISSFEDELAEESFKLKYDDMMRSLYEAEKKYY
jgi:hypothetical protein